MTTTTTTTTTTTKTALEAASSQPDLDQRGGPTSAWLRFPLLMILLCGLLYPVALTGLSALASPSQARGSLLSSGGVVVGSALVGQPFVSPHYFRGRPSAAGYDPTAVGGSNLWATSAELRARLSADAAAAAASDGLTPATTPPDLITASGSGIDPHISPAAAYAQSRRVSRARNIDQATLHDLITSHIEPPTWGVLGQPRVNVLRLNLSLDRLHPLNRADNPGATP
jgi:potassium-transporting ATPase KdpC subunit